jgi:hypothetical protein
MTHSTVYWHCATHTPSAGTGDYRPPHQHRLIAAAGIEVTGEDDEAGLGLNVDVWAIMSPDSIKPLARTLAVAAHHQRFVTLYGSNFGLPVLWSTALRLGVPMIGGLADKHTDLVREIGALVAPSNGLNFESVVDLLELPLRPDLNVIKTWESEDPILRQRIPKRLIVDCCFVALADIRLRLVQGDVSPEYADNFTRTVLEAANQKVSMVGKTFATFLVPGADAPEQPKKRDLPEAEDPDDFEEDVDEPTDDLDEDPAAAGPSDEFDDLDEDLEDDGPREVLEDFSDFGNPDDDEDF